MVPPESLVSRHLLVHVLLHVLLLLPLDDGRRPDGGEVLRVDRGVVGKVGRDRQLPRVHLEHEEDRIKLSSQKTATTTTLILV